jgi:aspartyl-tRNA synthetase
MPLSGEPPGVDFTPPARSIAATIPTNPDTPRRTRIMHAYRSHTCAALTRANVGETIRLSGWVHRRRDHGGVIFIDLRDHYGITQVLCDPDSPVFSEVEKVRAEYCIRIDGEVKARDPELVNPKLPTGEIEVFIRDMEVLGGVDGDLPLQVFGDQEYPEETRLKYRYLDLRREAMQANMTLRSDVVASIRRRMWDTGFREYQTPVITASSPEGARDFLVPSRLHPGQVLRAAAGAAAVQAASDGVGLRQVFPDRALFPRRGPARRPLAHRFLPARHGDVLRRAGGRVPDDRTGAEGRLPRVRRRAHRRRGLAAHLLPRRGALVRHRQARPAQPDEDAGVSEHFAGSGFAIFAKILEHEGTEVRAIPAPGGSRASSATG